MRSLVVMIAEHAGVARVSERRTATFFNSLLSSHVPCQS